MLSVGKVGPASAGYYQSAVVQGAEDYYAGDGDAPGRWVGRADLVGAVVGSVATAVEAGLLLQAKAAPDGSRLGKSTVTGRSVTAFDLTFSAPKSVSVLYALGDTRVVTAVEAAHTAAVLQSIASLSPRIAYTRTGHAGVAVVDAEGVLGIRYRHRTSRALDPQLHDHVLISNAVRTVSDGEWRTLDARGLYRQAKAAGVEYQAHLRAGLRGSLGVEFGDVDANGQADIVGIDDTVLVEFSTRSVDIETELENWVSGFVEREGRKPSPVEVGKAHKTITLATRTAKSADAALPTATLRERWQERADSIVNVERMLEMALGEPSPHAVRRPSIEAVLEAVESKHAQWAEAQLLEEIAARVAGPDPVTIAEVIEEVRAEAMGSFGVVDLTPPAEDGDRLRASDGRPVYVPPSAVRYTTRRHLQREVAIVEWATVSDTGNHRVVEVDNELLDGLDDGQVAAVVAMLSDPRPVLTVVGPAGAGKTTMLAAAVTSWHRAGISVFGVGPSATAARQLQVGAGTVADTLHKLVYEHSAKQTAGRGPADELWDLPARSVVIIDESGMVDTRLLHDYAQIAQAKQWRTVLVGDHRQLDSVDAGGMFAELVHEPDVVSVELDTLHRFHHEWEADASLRLRDGDPEAIAVYDSHGRIHGHLDHAAAVDAVADAAYVGLVEGRDVLVMAPTNAVVDELNATLTERLLAAGRLDANGGIDIAGHVFYPGQPVVTRVNNRTIRYGAGEWVRNGDRWTVTAGTRDELYLTNIATGDRLALPAEYTADGNVTVNYASTIHRAQGATVDEAHVMVNDRTNNRQLYVAATRGRKTNHIHAAPPAFDPDQHGPDFDRRDWSPTDAVAAVVSRQPDATSAIARRRQLRELINGTVEQNRGDQSNHDVGMVPPDFSSARAAAAAERLRRLSNKRSGFSLGR